LSTDLDGPGIARHLVVSLNTVRSHTKSIYRKLYEFVKQSSEQAGNVCGFRLYVEKENKRAQQVYERLGMNETYYLMYEEQK